MTSEASKAAVITMIRRVEFPAAWSSLETIKPQLGPNTVHFILLNDARDPEVETALEVRANTRVITPGRNLGVAVGRNTLIRAALEWGADTILSLDDDLLVPGDYVARIQAWIAERRRSGERVGIVAPAVLDFHAAAAMILSPEETTDAEEGRLQAFADTHTLRRMLGEAWPDGVPLDAIYHAGIRNWRSHYLENYRMRASQVRALFHNSRGIDIEDPGLIELRLDPVTGRAIVAGDCNGFPIDTAPGGACAYTAELLHAIGGIDESFSPFGYEDSDFAIRAVEAGFANYVLPGEVLLHDLDSRQKTRSPAVLLHSQGRARGLIGRKHLPRGERAAVLAETAALAPLQAVDLVGATSGSFPSLVGGAVGAIVAYTAGFAEGLFSVPKEPKFGAAAMHTDYMDVPAEFKRRFTTRFRTWAGTPTTGLPTSFLVDFDVAWSWHAEDGRLELTRITADAPGKMRVEVEAEILGVGLRDSDGNADPLGSQLKRARLVVEDWGLLRALQTTVAWFRNERSGGYLAPLLRNPGSQVARETSWFLSLRDTPARLEVSIEPPDPITVADLLALPPSVKLSRSLGLRAIVSDIAYY
jgi:GT2 family glycosyltransferase